MKTNELKRKLAAGQKAAARRYVELGARCIATQAIRFMAHGSRQFLKEVKA